MFPPAQHRIVRAVGIAPYALALTVGCAHAPPPPVAAVVPAPPAVAPPPASATPSATYAHFAVASDHPEASAAGAEVLAQGGSAADAVAATMLALGVASPASSGLGGGGFALYYSAHDHRVTFLDFRERAPAAATVDMLAHPAATGSTTAPTAAQTPGESLHAAQNAPDAGRPATSNGMPERTRAAGLAVGVPGEPRGIDELLHRFGRLPRADVVAPAARLAEQGFTPSAYMAGMSQRFAGALRRDPLGATWVPEGAQGIVAGARLTNPALAATLHTFANQGADVFYTGDIAHHIVDADQRIGGALTLDDLRGYAVTERPPLSADRFGHRWVTVPPESAGGYTLLTSLGLLEHWLPNSATTPPSETDMLHAMVESWRGPLLDRARYFTDPDFTRLPVDELLSSARINARAALFDPAHARPTADYDLPLQHVAEGEPGVAPIEYGTSHICVVDAEGNVASATTTVNIPFGAGTSVDGFWLNDQMDDFTTRAQPPGTPGVAVLPGGYANLPAPGHRPVSSMTPTIVFDGDQPVMCVGGSGGGYIITAVVQAAFRALVLGQRPEDAVTHPRIHQPASPDVVSAEAGIAPEVIAGLRARGHTVEDMHFGAMVQMITIAHGPQGVTLVAASDPRKGGRPAGL